MGRFIQGSPKQPKASPPEYHKARETPSCQYTMPPKWAESLLGNAKALQYTPEEAESATDTEGAQNLSMSRLYTTIPCQRPL